MRGSLRESLRSYEKGLGNKETQKEGRDLGSLSHLYPQGSPTLVFEKPDIIQ